MMREKGRDGRFGMEMDRGGASWGLREGERLEDWPGMREKAGDEFDEQRAWEEWWLAKEEGLENEHWRELSGDDLDMG